MDFDSYNGSRKAAAQQGRDVFGYAATGQARALVWDSAVQSPVIQEASLRGHARLDEFGRRIIDWTAEAYRLKHGADMPAKTAELLEPIHAELTKTLADMERHATVMNRYWLVDDGWPVFGAQEGTAGEGGRLSEEALGDAEVSGEALLAKVGEISGQVRPLTYEDAEHLKFTASGCECTECGARVPKPPSGKSAIDMMHKEDCAWFPWEVVYEAPVVSGEKPHCLHGVGCKACPEPAAEHECVYPPRDPLAKSGTEWCECGMGRSWYMADLRCTAPGFNVITTF